MADRLVPADGLDGDTRRQIMGEVEFPCRNAAESHAAQGMSVRKIQAGAVAGGQQLLIPLRDAALHNRPHGMQHIAAWQIVGGGHLGHARRFLMLLPQHDVPARKAQLHAGKGMDGIPYTYHNHTLRQAVKILRIYLCNRLGRGDPNTPRQHSL